MRGELELPWTGERLVTTHVGDTAVEHLHRYAFAREFAGGKDVLDIACGEGYGAYLLGGVARRVIGVDVAEEAVAHATRRYGDDARISFRVGACVDIPLPAASVDLVVSFETIEHLAEHERMMEEIKRVLRPGGTLVISTPDTLFCTILPGRINPYHVKELTKEDFAGLLKAFFLRVHLFEQKICHASVLTPGAGLGIAGFRNYHGDFRRLTYECGITAPIFNLAVATDGDHEFAFNVSLFHGLGIATEVERNLAEVEKRLAESEARRLALEERLLVAQAELQGIAVSRTWRLARGFRRMASPFRKLTTLTRGLLSKPAARS